MVPLTRWLKDRAYKSCHLGGKSRREREDTFLGTLLCHVSQETGHIFVVTVLAHLLGQGEGGSQRADPPPNTLSQVVVK